MFLNHQSKKQKEYYVKLLSSAGAISRLFSESTEPYLDSRIAENLFCKAFEAENTSRKDNSIDARKGPIGIGIKTFLNKNGSSLQKIAEFNGDHSLYNTLPLIEKVKKIAELRNNRITTTMVVYGLEKIIYHCIVREAGKILIYEQDCSPVNVKKIKNIKYSPKGSSITFSDSMNEYSFNLSKSTLYKRFKTENISIRIPIRMMGDPIVQIEKLVNEAGPIFTPVKKQPHVFLPLYSMKGGQHVPLSSGLNQWNANGRKRKPNEVYIPVPAWVHKKFKGFFPSSKDIVFELTLPDRTIMKASMCQQGLKALMSNPNTDLGKWILRDVLNLKEKEIVDYKKLQSIGLDTVVVYKVDKNTYDIDFAPIGSYEKFLSENGEKSKGDETLIEDEQD